MGVDTALALVSRARQRASPSQSKTQDFVADMISDRLPIPLPSSEIPSLSLGRLAARLARAPSFPASSLLLEALTNPTTTTSLTLRSPAEIHTFTMVMCGLCSSVGFQCPSARHLVLFMFALADNFKHLYSLQNDSATADYNQDILTIQREWTINNSIQKVSSAYPSPRKIAAC